MGKVIPLAELEPADDGLAIRDVGPWSREKLGILRNYLPAMTQICTEKRRPCYYVDGLAGPGINRILERRRGNKPPIDRGRVMGSPMIAVNIEPPFTSCLFMDQSPKAVKALRTRTATDPRVEVRRGDVNRDLLPAMRETLEPTSPGLVVLDPEGVSEVRWATIEQITDFRPGRRHPEILILFDTDALERMTPMYAVDPHLEEVLNGLYGHDRWKQIHERKVRGLLDTEDARTEYVNLYAQGFRDLGYAFAPIGRDVNARGRGGSLKYTLIFATDVRAGHDVMQWCFNQIFTDQQMTFPGMGLGPLPDRIEANRPTSDPRESALPPSAFGHPTA